MSAHPLKLDDALRALHGCRHALTTGALARSLHASELDVHVLMLTARANRLVYSTPAGAWTLTNRGRQALQQPSSRTSRP